MGTPSRNMGAPIFQFAADRNATILTHSGEENSLPDDLLPLADDHADAKLILAHLGCGYDGDTTRQVRAIQRSKRGNVFVDTSSMSSLFSGLIEWAVAEIGAERILFGTDSPLYDPATQRARIEHAEIRESEKRLILRDNAIRLLGQQLPENSTTTQFGKGDFNMTTRFSQGNLAACVLPWKTDWDLDTEVFQEHLQRTIDLGYVDLYLMGTAGEGYAVSDKQFEQVVRVFAAVDIATGTSSAGWRHFAVDAADY